MAQLIFPPFLQAGDTIYITSPSGKIDKRFLKGAQALLKSWGYQVKIAAHAASSCGKYAGTIKERLEDLQKGFDSPDIKAILCSRGGYGAIHLVERLDFSRFKENPKWLIGFSDITVLHNLIQFHGIASLHSPMSRHLTIEPANDPCTLYLKGILEGNLPTYSCPTHKLNHEGTAKGILRGGNLAVFNGLRGTRFDIPAEGTILFIEDVGERPHSIERMIYNLKIGGVLEKLSGLIIGQFTEYEEDLSLGKELYSAINDLLKEYTFPICYNFPVGHITHNLPLINGAEVELTVGKEVSLCFSSEKE